MIDNPQHVERLLAKITEALPMAARVTTELAATLQQPGVAVEIPPTCSVTSVSYAGDEGGIMCRLDFGPGYDNAVYTSITHLRFDPRLSLTRDITAYQKHRVKRIRRYQP
jgi:hypothetical protein